MRRALASAPCRADLAGGTLDIWPLSLLVERAVTVNAAIDLRTGCEIELGGDGWSFRARDGEEALRLPRLPERPDRQTPPAFRLAASVARWFELPPCRISTWSEAPRGSGLGGSSSLIVCLIGAARALRGEDWEASCRASIELARDLEARILGLPAGNQDHVAAWHGGLSLIDYGPGGWSRSDPALLAETSAILSEALVIVDTAVSHHSGMNNWQVVRAFLDGDAEVVDSLEAVARASVQMASLLRAGGSGEDLLAGLAEALAAEWRARRRLSPAVSCREVEALVAAAEAAGGRAKVCGAGGGGCLVAVAGRPGERAELMRALERAGGRPLPSRLATEGLRVDLS